ncbi:MAG TPA: molybdenum cofactor guanylyltransferase MobA [Gammaproteobacteria bacterium]|nr:molybdenum cofactor guanylyltransferase MobA [Gammaproteobacteria bacterium]
MRTSYSRSEVTAAVLAGGRARRMGGQDKGFIHLNGKPMVEYVLAALKPQAGVIVINANRSHDRYARYGYPVISDELSDFQGPLAGIVSCLANLATPYLLTVPCDSPLLPDDLGLRLYQALIHEQAELAVAYNGERLQPVFSLLRRELLESLLDFLEQGERKIDRWYARHKVARADFTDCPDAFLNINTEQERAVLAKRLQKTT